MYPINLNMNDWKLSYFICLIALCLTQTDFERIQLQAANIKFGATKFVLWRCGGLRERLADY
jgi:hypothetical protein